VRTLGALVGGQVVSTYEDEAGEAVNVRVRLPEALRQDVRQVGNLRMAISGGDEKVKPLVSIADLVTAERVVSPSEISRQDLRRQVVIAANLDQLPLGTAAEASMRAAAKVPMAPGYHVKMSGDTEIMLESFGYLAEALLLAVIFVYLVLAAQFESFIDPLAIMFSLPLSIVGMAGALLLTGDTVNIMSLIGLILLMGLVTKNAILLVDFTKVLRRKGMDRRTALVTAGRTRLRPIMMTTLAMIFGMAPLALGLGQGAEMRAPMGRAVIGGLVTSTLLTLIVVPVVYTLLDDFAEWLHRRWKKANALEADAAAPSSATAKVGAALLAALLVPGVAAGVEPLTLEQAVKLAETKNRDVAKARAYQEWVRGKYVEERAAAFPHLSAQASYGRSWDGSFQAIFGDLFPAGQTTKTADITLSQTVITWGQVGAAVRGAKHGIAAAEDQLDHYRQAAVRDVTEAFHDVLLARRLEEIAKETLARRERQLAEAEGRHTLGIATDYDVLAARVARDNQRPDVLRATNLVARALDRLRLVLAEEALDLDVTGTLEAEIVEPPAADAILASALDRRPDLRSLGHAIGVYGELVKIRNADDKPRLDLKASAGWKWLEAGPVAADGKAWSAGLYFSFPFFDGFAARGRVAQAKSDVTRAELDLAKARDGVVLELRAAVDAVRVAAEIVRALSGSVAQARRLLEMSEQGHELGAKTRLDVDDALLNVRLAEGSLAKARRDYLVARTNLLFAEGRL